MNADNDKLTSLKAAIERYVKDGDHICLGGFTINRNPMAAVYEIIRRRKKNLHLYAHSNGQGLDELIGGGCVDKLEIAYGGSGRFAPTCVRFRQAVENASLAVEDYTNYQMALRFAAGAMGVPFLPTRSSLGSDIIAKWGFSPSMRKNDPKIPDDKLKVIDNPFGEWGDSPKLALVPAVNPDVCLLHAQKADRRGTVRIEGLTFADIEQAKSSKHVIVTCEEVAEISELKRDADLNQLPFFYVDAVVHVPWGAYPTACHRYYDYDPQYLYQYQKWAKDDELFKAYQKKYIFQTENHQGFLKLALKDPERIKADKRTGYATGLKRK